MSYIKTLFKDLNLYDLIINAVYSICFTILFFNVFVSNTGYSTLTDFYTGVSIYENYNKFYDLAFLFVYIVNYLLFLIPYRAIKKRIFSCQKAGLKLKTVLGLLALFCFGEVFFNNQIFVDPHHQAEHLNTFFMHTKFNMEYYKDIMLVHGLRDTAPGWLGHYIFGSDSLYSFYQGSALFYNLLTAGFILLSLFVFSNGLFFIIPLIGLFVHDNLFVLLGVYILAFLALLKLKKPTAFLSLYIIISFAFASFWTSMGFLWITAALPAALYSFLCVLKEENRNKKLLSALAAFLICLAVCFKSLLSFFHQAVFYAKANLYAFGTAMPKITYDYAGFFIKLFAVISIPVFCILIYKEFQKTEKNKDFIFAMFFAVIITLFSLNYTMGRIDSDSFVRLSYISYTFIFILVPYFIYTNYKKISETFIKYLILICSISLIFFSLNRCVELLHNFLLKPSSSSKTLDVRNDEKSAIEDITGFIRQSLKENETFLDLTNKGLLYYLLDTKMPVPYVSYYNIVNTKQVEEIKNIKPDVIYINDTSERIDELYPSLRINPLYREIVLSQNYKLIKGKKDMALLKKEVHIFSDSEKQDLDRYLSKPDIKYLPDAWGASIDSLPLEPVSINYSLQKADLDNSTIFNIHFDKPVKGIDFDLIYINTQAGNKNANYVMKINNSLSVLFFQSRTNRMLVPFDNYPSWLLNDKITDIAVKTDLKFDKNADIRFYKRAD